MIALFPLLLRLTSGWLMATISFEIIFLLAFISLGQRYRFKH